MGHNFIVTYFIIIISEFLLHGFVFSQLYIFNRFEALNWTNSNWRSSSIWNRTRVTKDHMSYDNTFLISFNE